MAYKQEPRVTVVVTPDEKRDVQLVAIGTDRSESDVMRDMTMAEVVAEAERIRGRIAEAA